MKRRLWMGALLATVALQMAVLAGLAAYSQYPIWVGQSVRLAVKPRDPRDPLRGQYLSLRYDLDTLPVPEDGVPRRGRTVYVTLRRDGRLWRAGAATFTAPDTGLYLRGRIRAVDFDHIEVRYGIEAWFTSPERAAALAQALRGGGIARVKVAPDGRAALLDVRPAAP